MNVTLDHVNVLLVKCKQVPQLGADLKVSIKKQCGNPSAKEGNPTDSISSTKS
jgi:hypothetical protein